jgi:hypothetical protein
MKLTNKLLSGLALIFFLGSCKKDNNTPNNNLSSDQPKSYIEDVQSTTVGNSTTTYTLTYDANKRLINSISNSSPQLKSTFHYNSDNTYSFDMLLDNVLDIHEDFWVGSNSFVDSTFQYNSTYDTSTEKYIYNSSQLLSQIKEYDYSNGVSTLFKITNYTYDNNGNLISEASNTGSIAYDYTDLPYTLNVGLVYFNVPKFFPKTETFDTSETLTHTYTFDDKKRLVTDKAVASYGDVYTKTYNY